jgi:hypothetical protein
MPETKICVICTKEFETSTADKTTCSNICDRKEFEGFVKNEADGIRKYASSEEINRLDFTRIAPKSKSLCIYGQMTGDCYSARAYELLNLCTKPYSRTAHMVVKTRVESFETPRDFSPIETYLCFADPKIKNLVAYIKGESNKLVL